MSYFDELRVQGFRRLHDVTLKLKPLNVMIGANGSGKTSLLDVFTILSAAANGNLAKTISDIGGIKCNRTSLKNKEASSLIFEIQITSESTSSQCYRIALTESGPSFVISEESLDLLDHALQTKSSYFQQTNSRLTISGDEWPMPKSTPFLPDFRLFGNDPFLGGKLKASLVHVSLDVSKRAPIRLPQPVQGATLPGANGEDLVACLFTLRETDPDRFELIQETLRAGFPTFERLDFPPIATGMLAMTWKETTRTQPFHMHQLSGGTLRFLWLVTLLMSPNLPAITLIDEPEVSLHPELLSLLADVMREASQRTQLFVATHADRLVRFLRPHEVLTMNVNDDGMIEPKWADEFDLEQWLDEYTLDEVWRLGRMGGRS